VAGLAGTLVLLLGVPVCFSAACPMGPAQRASCLAMGRDCCRAQGQVSHGPAAPAPVLATAPALASVTAPATPSAARPGVPDPGLEAAPAVVQGVGLFTLFAVFLI
jgi:hypothetical protein